MMKKKNLLVFVDVLALSILAACQGNPTLAAAISDLSSSKYLDVQESYLGDALQTTQITLNGDSITTTGSDAIIDGNTVTILSAGTYSISGSLVDGQIIVDTQDTEPVTLILNGVNISSSTSAPIYISSAESTAIVLANNTQNIVSDSASYIFASADEDEPNAAIFSKDDLTIDGNGTLTVNANYNDGIASKDEIVIANGTVIVNSVDDGIRGKDSITIQGGTITVNAQGDGLKSDNDSDATKGYIAIENGVINVTAGGDAIQSQADVTITDGNITLSSGGGSSNWVDETVSAKGIKGTASVTINGGTFTIDSADDAIHSNDSIVINGGTLVIASGDDGMHADSTLEINNGDITITKSYEGLESAIITINGGNFDITSSDDGINVAGGNDGSGMMPGMGGGGRGGFGQDASAASGNYYLYINGGYIVVNAEGDGLDSNGSITMTGGTIIVNGPTQNMNGALDYVSSFNITGGFLVAVGSAGMAEAPDQSSTQYSLLLNFTSALQAGTLVHIQSSDGNEILTFAPAKQFQSVVVSSPELMAGTTYDVYYGGSSGGVASDGLYPDGTYSGGTQYTSFTVSSVVTWVGASGGMGGGFAGGAGGRGGFPGGGGKRGGAGG